MISDLRSDCGLVMKGAEFGVCENLMFGDCNGIKAQHSSTLTISNLYCIPLHFVIAALKYLLIVVPTKLPTKMKYSHPHPHSEHHDHHDHHHHHDTMKAVEFEGKAFDMKVKKLPIPKVRKSHDAIIRVTSSGICGKSQIASTGSGGSIPDFASATSSISFP